MSYLLIGISSIKCPGTSLCGVCLLVCRNWSRITEQVFMEPGIKLDAT